MAATDLDVILGPVDTKWDWVAPDVLKWTVLGVGRKADKPRLGPVKAKWVLGGTKG